MSVTRTDPHWFQVRPATLAELGACRALLPEAFPAVGRAPDCQVAESGSRMLAAGAMLWLPGGFPVQVHVVPDARCQGVGRALLASLREAARGETGALRSLVPVTDGSGAAAFLLRCGFTVAQRLQVHESDPAQLGASMTALLGRVRPRIPAGVALVPPPEAPAEAVAALLAQSFAAGLQDLAAALSGEGVNAWAPDLSRVLLVEGVVAGAVLARRAGATLEVDFNIVAPEWRGGWANLLLVEAVLRNGRTAGLTRLRFLAEAHVRDTVNLARRAGAMRLADRLAMVLPLGEGQPGA